MLVSTKQVTPPLEREHSMSEQQTPKNQTAEYWLAQYDEIVTALEETVGSSVSFDIADKFASIASKSYMRGASDHTIIGAFIALYVTGK